MSKSNVAEVSGREAIADPLTELLRTGAKQLLGQCAEKNWRRLRGFDYPAKVISARLVPCVFMNLCTRNDRQ